MSGPTPTPAQLRVLGAARDGRLKSILRLRESDPVGPERIECRVRGWVAARDDGTGYELTPAGRAALDSVSAPKHDR